MAITLVTCYDSISVFVTSICIYSYLRIWETWQTSKTFTFEWDLSGQTYHVGQVEYQRRISFLWNCLDIFIVLSNCTTSGWAYREKMKTVNHFVRPTWVGQTTRVNILYIPVGEDASTTFTMRLNIYYQLFTTWTVVHYYVPSSVIQPLKYCQSFWFPLYSHCH